MPTGKVCSPIKGSQLGRTHAFETVRTATEAEDCCSPGLQKLRNGPLESAKSLEEIWTSKFFRLPFLKRAEIDPQGGCRHNVDQLTTAENAGLSVHPFQDLRLRDSVVIHRSDPTPKREAWGCIARLRRGWIG